MEHHVNRRRFLGAAIGTGAAAAAAAGAPATALGRDGDWDRGSRGEVPRNRRAIQMWTMRMLIEDERLIPPAEVFSRLGQMGYTEVELAGHYGLPARELRRQIERAGLRAISGHDGPGHEFNPGWQDGYRETLEYAAELGQKFTGFAWYPGPYTTDYFRFLAENFNEVGEIAREEFGLQFFYHNHDFEFTNKQPNGEPNFNVLLEETDRNLVKFQLDIYWILTGGEDPIAYLSADPGRYWSYHVKDKTWKDRPNADDFEDVPTGSVDWPQVFDTGDGRGLDKHYVVEHDSPWLSHPDDPEAEYKTAQNAIDYLRRVSW
jgi:sugar phosphate isomerase/epimerase